LAARNVLLRNEVDSGTGARECVLIDTAVARLYETSEHYTKTKTDVSLKWTAPEVLKSKKFSEKSDIYSFGIIAIECFTRTIPFPDMSALECANAVASGKLEPKLNGICPDSYLSVLNPCLSHNPDKRPLSTFLVVSFVL